MVGQVVNLAIRSDAALKVKRAYDSNAVTLVRAIELLVKLGADANEAADWLRGRR